MTKSRRTYRCAVMESSTSSDNKKIRGSVHRQDNGSNNEHKGNSKVKGEGDHED